MLILEGIIASAIVVFVVGGLFFVIVLERSGTRARWNPVVWWWSLVGLGLLGAAIAFITSSIF